MDQRYFIKISLYIDVFLDIRTLKSSITNAGILFDKHSTISTKKRNAFNFEIIKTTNSVKTEIIKTNIYTEEKNILNKEQEALIAFQNKEIERLKNMCRELTQESKHSQKTKEEEEIVIHNNEENSDKNRILKKNTPGKSSDSIFFKNMVDSWPEDQESFKNNSEDWQFQFKRTKFQNKNKINQINVQLKHNCDCLLSIEEIRIISSESK